MAVTVTWYGPPAAEPAAMVPEISPVLLMVRPAGRPVAVNVGVPAAGIRGPDGQRNHVPFGPGLSPPGLVTVTGLATFHLNIWLAPAPPASVAVTVT